MKYTSRLASTAVVLAGVGLVILFWLIDAAFDRRFYNPDHSFLDCLLRPEAPLFWARLLVGVLFVLLIALAAFLLRRKENAEARLRHGSFRLEEQAVELAQKNDLLLREIARRRMMEAELEKLAVTDQLTGIPNRRKFDEILNNELRQEGRYPRGLSLVMLDIDHFKVINDKYGHAAGDLVLKELAALLDGAKRQADTFFRIGGEEFCVITYSPNHDNLRVMAEKMRHLVGQHHFSVAGHLTISLGATRHMRGDDYDSLYQRTDSALYKAKETGRNRVIVA